MGVNISKLMTAYNVGSLISAFAGNVSSKTPTDMGGIPIPKIDVGGVLNSSLNAGDFDISKIVDVESLSGQLDGIKGDLAGLTQDLPPEATAQMPDFQSEFDSIVSKIGVE